MRAPDHGGGWQALRYTWRKGRQVGFGRLWRAMRSRNACKTCALGMGGQKGGMANERGAFPEVCKKSLQAMAADMMGRIDERFFAKYSIQDLQTFSPLELEACGRLAFPVAAEPGATHFRPIGWGEAIDAASAALKATDPERSFFYASGRSSNEAGFLMQLFARVYGTNHVTNCSYYCHQASGYGMKDSLGTPVGTVDLEDVESCDLMFLIGANPASNHPRLMTQLMKLRNRGGHVIVGNPVLETGLVRFKVPSNARSMVFGTEIASLYLQPKIGGDIALMTGIAKRLFETGKLDRGFIESATEGIEELSAMVEGASWREIEEQSGLGRDEIEAAADLFANANKTIFGWTMGITHHEHGVQNVQWIVNLALLRGMVGRPGAGLLPIRGHSNVQGMGTVGVMPFVAQAAAEKLETMGVRVPKNRGHDPLQALELAHEGGVDLAFCMGGNLHGASPDARFVGEAFEKIGTTVYLSTTLNTGHAHGLGKTTLILPVLARDEETQSTTQESMFSYVRLSDGGQKRFEGPLPETEVLCSIALGVLGAGGAFDWEQLKSHDAIRALISQLVPSLKPIVDIGETKQEFEISGRILHRPEFPRPGGKAAFRAHPMPALPPLGEGEIRLMTVRSEGQFNTIVYEDADPYRGQERRDVILMCAADLMRLGLKPDDPVDVIGPAGTMRGLLAREWRIAEGCALMYYPECNVLLPRTADPKSRTPAFKSTVVRVAPSLGEPQGRSGERLKSLRIAESRSTMKAC
ncbi:MAG: FdhF/YdeP family oxidoreductase [Armatimonadetes bacterium]|nr:FdhF/YdeP family oxidoreductase [Armatimonadota bacterium]